MNNARLQFNRVKRYYERIQLCGTSNEAYDDLLAFFENCWHLKDHLKASLPPGKAAQIEKDVDNCSAVRIIADLANRSKPLELTRNIREDALITHKFIQVYDGPQQLPGTARYQITLGNGSTFNVLENHF